MGNTCISPSTAGIVGSNHSGSGGSHHQAHNLAGSGVTSNRLINSSSNNRIGQFKVCQLQGCPKLVHVDRSTNIIYDHCCREHAIRDQRQQQQQQSSMATSATQAQTIYDQKKQCLFPGCTRMAAFNRTAGAVYDYCSKEHAAAAASALPAGQSSSSTGRFLPPCNYGDCNRPCATDARSGFIHQFCETHSSAAAPSPAIGTLIIADADAGKLSDAKVISGSASQQSAPSKAVPLPPPLAAASRKCALVGCYKLCAVDPRTGWAYDYCSREHAKAAERLSSLVSVSPSGECMLDKCGKPRTPGHDYCCRDHALQARAEMSNPTPSSDESCVLPGCNKPRARGYDHCSKEHAVQTKSIAAVPVTSNKCMLAGCRKPRSAGYDYCCRDHALKSRKWGPPCALHGCSKSAFFDPQRNEHSLYCTKEHMMEGNQILKEFKGGQGDSEFSMRLLGENHPKYMSVKQQFTDKWWKSTTAPPVVNILQIRMSPNVVKKYEAYKNRVGNERRRFHGTTRAWDCNFFAGLKGNPCATQSCVACNICMVGFKLIGTNQKTFARYGRGLYFSSVSGKSNDYAGGSEQTHNGVSYRTMFLCCVAVGSAKVTQQDFLRPHECPGTGFDSVVANTGGGLNYDEVVVYDEDAALPSYMIVYKV